MADDKVGHPQTSEEFLVALPLREDLTKLRAWLLWLSMAVWAFSTTSLTIQKLAVPGTSIEIVPPAPAELRLLLTCAVFLFTVAFILGVYADSHRLWEQWRQIVKSEHGVVRRWRHIIVHRTGRPFLAVAFVWVFLPAAIGVITFLFGLYRSLR